VVTKNILQVATSATHTYIHTYILTTETRCIQGKQYPSNGNTFYNGAFHDSIDGEGEGQNDPDQVVVVGRHRIFLHDTKECFQHAAQDRLCQIRSNRSKTGFVQGAQNKITISNTVMNEARPCIPYKMYIYQ
jgi:hypothetical protein